MRRSHQSLEVGQHTDHHHAGDHADVHADDHAGDNADDHAGDNADDHADNADCADVDD